MIAHSRHRARTPLAVLVAACLFAPVLGAVDARAALTTAQLLCGADAPASVGTVQTGSLSEISGVAVSRKTADTLWVHNDSGDSARVFALRRNGATRGVWYLSGASAVDWEDIAVGPGPKTGTAYLYVGDIGDNGSVRSEIQVYRVPEPSPNGGGTLSGVSKLRFRYPDGAHDAEAMFIAPVTGNLFVVTKSSDGVAGVYRAVAPLTAGPTTLTKVATVSLGSGHSVTAADLSRDGTAIVLRTYTRVYVYARASRQLMASALAGSPCLAPAPSEQQGEALGIDANNGGFVTISEGWNEPVYAVSG